MKTIDKIRNTNSFNIGANHIQYLTILKDYFGDGLIAVAYDNLTNHYTVRVSEYVNHMPVKLVDHVVKVPLITRGKSLIEIIDTTVIHDWS